MTIFDRTWDSSYEASPPDTEDINLGATRIRNLKVDVREREAVDHSWAGDANDGKHNRVTLRFQASAPTLDATDGALYSAIVGGVTEVFYKDSNGNVTQLTAAGTVMVTFAAGNFGVAGNLAVDGVAAVLGAMSVNGTLTVGGDLDLSDNTIRFLEAGTPADTRIVFDISTQKFVFVIGGVAVGSFPP